MAGEDRSNVTQLTSVLLEEYKGIRQEITTRSTSQATILSLNITAIGAIASVFFAGHIKDVRLFFIIPVISSILGLIYTDHALNIGKLGKFLRWQVKPRLANALGLGELVDYEVYTNNYVPPVRVYNQVLPVAIIAMFIAIPMLAILVPFTDLIGTSKVEANIQNLALAFPGMVLLALFLVVYYSVHYGGRLEAGRPARAPFTVSARDFET